MDRLPPEIEEAAKAQAAKPRGAWLREFWPRPKLTDEQKHARRRAEVRLHVAAERHRLRDFVNFGAIACAAAITTAPLWLHHPEKSGALYAMAGGFRLHGGRATGGALSATLAVPTSGFRKIDTVSGFQAWLNTVDDSNMVMTTVTGSLGVQVWPFRTVDNTQSRLWVRRQLREMILVNANGQSLGASGTVQFSSHTGANGTGSLTTFTVGLTVDNTPPARYALGAKSLPRHGGPLISQWGAASISDIKNSSGSSIAGASWPFEIFGGRLVWKATNGTSSSYGTIRNVPYSSGLVGTGTYTVVFDNAVSLPIDVLDNTLDVAPSPSAVGETGGDTFQMALAQLNRYAGDVIRCEDGAYNISGGLIIPWMNSTGMGAPANFNTTGPPVVNPGGGPSLPSSTEMVATASYDLTPGTGWVRVQAMNPLGVTFASPVFFKPTGMGTTGAPLNFLYEYMDLRGPIDSFGQYPNQFGWTCDPSVLGAHPTANMTLSWLAFRFNRMGGGTLQSHSGSPLASVQNHHWFVRDNYWNSPQDQGLVINVTDSEVISNFFEYGHDHDIHGNIYNSTAGSHFAKVWWNIHINKYMIDGAAHPNMMQQLFSVDAGNGPSYNFLYFQDPTNGGAGWELASYIGNIGFGGHRGTILVAGAGYLVGDTAPDSQCYNSGDNAGGLIYYIGLGNLLTMGNFDIGFALDDTGGHSVFRDNGFMTAWNAPITRGQSGLLGPTLKIRGDGDSNGTGSFVTIEGNYCAINLVAWAGTQITAAGNPNVTNISNATIAATAVTTPDPGVNVQYLEDILAAVQPVPGGILFPAGKPGVGPIASGNYDFRRQTFVSSRMTP